MKPKYIKNLLSGCCKADIYEKHTPKYLGGSVRYCANCGNGVMLEKNINLRKTPPEESATWAIAIKNKCVLLYKGTKTETKKYIQELIKDKESVVDYFEYNSKDYYYFIHGPLWKESI
tara:strand:- start:2970 stop:3323 length:354 start_codon:yes stop_codon:yes gene_type:complete